MAATRGNMLDTIRNRLFSSAEDADEEAEEPLHRDAEVLHELYVIRDMSKAEIARELGVSKSTVDYWLHVHQVNQGEPWKPSQLEVWYWQDDMTLGEIADICNVSDYTVGKWMDRAGIPRRDPGPRSEDPIETQPESDNYREEDKLREMVVDRGMTHREIGKECGVHHTTVGYWARKFGIDKEE